MHKTILKYIKIILVIWLMHLMKKQLYYILRIIIVKKILLLLNKIILDLVRHIW